MNIYIKYIKLFVFKNWDSGIWHIYGGDQINGSSLSGKLGDGPIPTTCKWPGPAVHRQTLACMGKTTINGTN